MRHDLRNKIATASARATWDNLAKVTRRHLISNVRENVRRAVRVRLWTKVESPSYNHMMERSRWARMTGSRLT